MAREKRLLRCCSRGRFFLVRLCSIRAIVDHNLGGRGRRCGGRLGNGGLRVGNLGVLGAYGLQQPGAEVGPAILQPGAGLFQTARIGCRASQARGFSDPKQYVIESIQIAEDGESRESAAGPLAAAASACAINVGRVVLRSRCMELISCCVVARISLGAFQWATLRLVRVFWTLASAGRRLFMGKAVGAGTAAAAGVAGGGACALAAPEPPMNNRVEVLLEPSEGNRTFFLP